MSEISPEIQKIIDETRETVIRQNKEYVDELFSKYLNALKGNPPEGNGLLDAITTVEDEIKNRRTLESLEEAFKIYSEYKKSRDKVMESKDGVNIHEFHLSRGYQFLCICYSTTPGVSPSPSIVGPTDGLKFFEIDEEDMEYFRKKYGR